MSQSDEVLAENYFLIYCHKREFSALSMLVEEIQYVFCFLKFSDLEVSLLNRFARFIFCLFCYYWCH